jgi:membrane peptidoglycan carboxypeptidase
MTTFKEVLKNFWGKVKKAAKKIHIPAIIRKHPWLSAGYAILIGILAVGIFLFVLARTLPSVEEITTRQVAQSTKIYDRTGEIPLYELSAGERRTVIPFDEIPQSVKDAVLAAEDQQFYNESAVSIRGIIRAFFVNLLHGGIVQGGSTITQQLAKNAFLTLDQTPVRKLKELLLAIRINQNYTKDQILALYLNEIPYGPSIYGVETASQVFFGKPARELTLAQSATLVGIAKAPSYYSPWGSHLSELMARKDSNLKKMRDFGKITDAQMTEAMAEKITFNQNQNGIKAPHFVFAVQDYLVKKYGEDMVRTGGLHVITTLDMKLQTIAEAKVLEGADRNTKLYDGHNAALMAEDPKTGQILAMVGSRDFFDTENEGNYNVATQGLRQPGSALKPFVYLTAFEKGYVPDTVLFDVATEFVPNNPNCPAVPNYNKTTTSCFHPQDFDPFVGPVSMRNALAQSMNIPAVKTLYLVGIKQALSTLSDFGITTLVDPRRYGLSLVLGGGEVHLSELLGAYSALAEDGTKHDQSMILEVRDAKGNVLESYEDNATNVADPQYVRMVNSVLSDVNARAPLYSASLNLTVFPGREVAMKTGTTNDYHDAWTFGYTPSLAVGVWAGNNDNTAMKRNGSSILAALPIWSAFMKEAITSYPEETFTRPEPTYPEKPVLRGDYLSTGDGVHDILYYVNKNDPTGPAPLNPEDDAQFYDWETGVQNWVGGHPLDFPLASSTASSTPNGSSTFPFGLPF